MKHFFTFSLFIIPLISFSQQTVGLFLNDSLSYNGYTLFAPSGATETYLIDNCGRLINSWSSAYQPGASVYLLENGDLLRTARIGSPFNAGGSGGRIERFDWEGNLSWSYNYSTSDYHQHHDIEPLANGNILVLAWEKFDQTEAILAGRDPNRVSFSGVWAEKVVEITPVGIDQIQTVWEWRLWDHLVQDFDSTKENYGLVGEHPELMDVNYGATVGTNPDWIHANSIDYNPTLDQIVISSRHLHEIYVIDHSTTTAEAASHIGGASGKGGDFLYRWGNPATYRQDLFENRQLFGQHDANWIADSLPDGGGIMVFNNGWGRTNGSFSTVDVIIPPKDSAGNYVIPSGQAIGPDSASWRFSTQPPQEMFSSRISGARRLPNGNTLICDGTHGHFREVTYDGTLVWEYINPIRFGAPVLQGTNINQNDVFRVSRYGEEYAAFEGKDMTPGDPIELNPLPYACTIYSADSSTTDTSLTSTNPFMVNAFVKYYPNPFSDKIVVERLDGRSVHLSILNSKGQLIWETWMQEEREEIPAANWVKGLYVLRVSNEHHTLTHKILKQ